MKTNNYLIIVLLLFSFLQTSYSQEKYKCVINKNNNSVYQLISENGDTIASMSEDTLILKKNDKLIFLRGKGWKKDKKGERERNKRYLINQNNDTLFTIRTKLKELQINDKYYHYERINNCWIVFTDNDILLGIWFSFDEHSFRFSIKTLNAKDSFSEDIIKFIIPFLKEIAMGSESDEDDDNIWLILFTTLILN